MDGVTIAVVFGINLLLIGAIAGLVHWLGRSAKARLESEEAARALFQAEFPDARIAEIALTDHGALLALADTPAIGLIVALGAHWLVRKIDVPSVRAATIAGSKIVLRLRDFTAPRLTLDLGTAPQAARWCGRLAPVQA